MSRFFKILDEKYSTIDFASNFSAFDSIKHGVYMWYYPIHLNHKRRDIHSALDLFYEQDHMNYNLVNEVLVDDKTRNLRTITIGTKIGNQHNKISSKTKNHDEHKVSEVFGDLFTGLSVLNKPVYIGKSSPRNPESHRNLSNRINEHLQCRSDFGLAVDSLSNEIELKDFVVKVIDIGLIDEHFFNGEFISNREDLANFVEIHLINILKPNFNIAYK